MKIRMQNYDKERYNSNLP